MEEQLYINRELSWLEFNRRVLEEAQDESVPLLERVKFLAIFSSNLDEFFMVRVARLQQRVTAGDKQSGPDGLTPTQTLAAIAERVHRLAEEQHRCFLEDLQPRLVAEGIRIIGPADLTEDQKRIIEERKQRAAVMASGTPRKGGNSLFRVTRYGLNHSAFEGRTLTPGKTLVEIQDELDRVHGTAEPALAKAKSPDTAK